MEPKLGGLAKHVCQVDFCNAEIKRNVIPCPEDPQAVSLSVEAVNGRILGRKCEPRYHSLQKLSQGNDQLVCSCRNAVNHLQEDRFQTAPPP